MGYCPFNLFYLLPNIRTCGQRNNEKLGYAVRTFDIGRWNCLALFLFFFPFLSSQRWWGFPGYSVAIDKWFTQSLILVEFRINLELKWFCSSFSISHTYLGFNISRSSNSHLFHRIFAKNKIIMTWMRLHFSFLPASC